MSFRLANVHGRAALVDGDHYHDIAATSTAPERTIGPDPMDAIAHCAALHELAGRLGDLEPTGALADVTLGPPVPRPRNSFGIGLNYRAHAEESGRDLPPNPVVFAKYPSCIAGPTAEVELRSNAADYEAELVVVIGTAGRDIAAADAWDHVAGVTCGQDISDRKVQFAAEPPHFGLGKSRDGYGPIGPVLVSPDALADRDALAITCDVNGERRQDGNTSDLIFDVPALIEYISGILTLAPGDLIFTGTPEGVGAAQGKFLTPGDVITTTIDGVGTMTNTCR
ncbi:MAG: fumarylacetoacetate hydrolase family protein [Ilumatobacter sp.]|uniref:fumarylacetoacetate hydrolase family protein n=1 Tax=Ilumatobacter sp. TaxID=1967498 RepID=UPI00261AEE25|nr:fumarylacetoacetate hydrolase family protein [Ilumatobacter sp.]MDJ0769404.1 fumarylacetoacetate hydrolase family protein [Ilumatobacter sp.]